ncbi:MAG TPA: hypothetical protein VND80_02830 [Steroidobacteraceae bacterium]|nr:hypothetical protein [Steroidobacteraceae bacterium]
MQTDLPRIDVGVDAYQVSPEPVLLTAELRGALALCLHDARRSVGGLLHLRTDGAGGRPSELTDTTLSAVLVVLARFKRAVLGNAARRDELQARIVAHAPPTDAAQPSATLVDLIRADLADGRWECAAAMLREGAAVRVNFEPVGGRLWICGPNDAVPRLRQGRL